MQLHGCYSLYDKKETFEATIYSNGIDGSFLSALFHNANVSEATLTPQALNTPPPPLPPGTELFLLNLIIDQFEGKAVGSLTPNSAACTITLKGGALTRAVKISSKGEQV